MRCKGHYHMGEMRNTNKFNWKTYREKTTGKRRHRWKDNINADLKQAGVKMWTGYI
jgi:hypothetical protein